MSKCALVGMLVEAVVCMAQDAGLHYSVSESEGTMWLTVNRDLTAEFEFDPETREIIDVSYI